MLQCSPKTIVFDFDGVIHSYSSGWRGVDCIPDPPVPGISASISRLREKGYNVVVVSTRCRSPEGMDAVKAYLESYNIMVDDVMATKPPAVCYIDDRAICFDGNAESLFDKVESFRPWNEQVN